MTSCCSSKMENCTTSRPPLAFWGWVFSPWKLNLCNDNIPFEYPYFVFMRRPVAVAGNNSPGDASLGIRPAFRPASKEVRARSKHQPSFNYGQALVDIAASSYVRAHRLDRQLRVSPPPKHVQMAPRGGSVHPCALFVQGSWPEVHMRRARASSRPSSRFE